MKEVESAEEWKNFFSERITGLRLSHGGKLSSRKLSASDGKNYK